MENSPAYLIAYFYSPDWSLIKGGTGTLGEVMLNHALSVGVDVKLGVKVSGVEVSGDLVKGVETNQGVIRADLFVSSVSPLELNRWLGGRLIKRTPPKPGWRKYNIVLKEYPKLPQELKPFAHSIIDTEAGEMLIPSILDETRGGVVIEFMGDLDSLIGMMPDMRDKVIAIDELTPERAEAMYNVPNGDVNHLPMRVPYILENRPGYTTPFMNLFQGSAGNYPGGQITGVPGYNAAKLAAAMSSGFK
jgi:Phytoene dehydrogenase and related proteins